MKNSKNRLVTFLLILFSFVLSLGLVACGGDQDGERLTIDGKVFTTYVGESETIELAELPAYVKDGEVELLWTSSAPEVAQVSNGEFQALSLGETTITVSTADGRFETSCTVRVIPLPNAESEKILLIERSEGDSAALAAVLTEGGYDFEAKTFEDEDFPKTVAALVVGYGQVILNGITTEELPEGFDVVLEEYANEHGGGVFSIGTELEKRDEEESAPLFEQMLPVEYRENKAPMGVVVIIDRSGSMGQTDEDGETLLDWAKTATLSCLSALSEQDYISVMTLDYSQNVLLPLTARTEDEKIREAIESIDFASGGTIYSDAIYRAGQTLLETDLGLARKHIIMISDGATPEEEVELCVKMLESFYQSEITFSFIGVNLSSVDYEAMKIMTDAGHGNLIDTEDSKLLSEIRKDLTFDCKVMGPYEFVVDSRFAELIGIEEADQLKFSDFYFRGLKEGAEALITGIYDYPLYAEWSYGKGKVGYFASDLNGVWSGEFLASEAGKKIVWGILDGLFYEDDTQ